MTFPATPIDPSPTELARTWALDVAEPSVGALSWQTVFGMSAFQESKSNVTADGSTFETGVLQVNEAVGFTLDLTGSLKIKKYQNAENDGQRIIREAAESYEIPLPQLWGRWYKRDGSGDAKKALFQAEWTPQSGGTTDLLQVNFALHAQTLPTIETNPASGGGSGEPEIVSITPSGKTVGDMITLRGNGFGDASAVDIDSTSADFVVVNAGLIIATIPSGVATGAVDVVVTNSAGPSTPFSYTVSV